MSHVVKIHDFKTLSDGATAVLGRCCDDPQHSSWHTMYPSVVLDNTQFTASIDEFKQRLMDQHEAAIQAEEHLKTLVGTSTDIDPHTPSVAVAATAA